MNHAPASASGNGLVSLATAARRLNINAAAVRFWAETFEPDLLFPRDAHGNILFSPKHLTAIADVHRLVTHEGLSIAESRRLVHRRLRDEANHTAQSTNGNISTQIRSVRSAKVRPQRAQVPSGKNKTTKPTSELVDHRRVEMLEKKVTAMSSMIQEMAHNVEYLLEENRALQQLIARLIEHIEKEPTEKHGEKTHEKNYSIQNADQNGQASETKPFLNSVVRSWVPQPLPQRHVVRFSKGKHRF